MISAKNIYGSVAYKQLKAYAGGDKALLAKLVEKFVHNSNMQRPEREVFKKGWCVCASFVWHKTTEGHTFWNKVDFNSDGRWLWNSL